MPDGTTTAKRAPVRSAIRELREVPIALVDPSPFGNPKVMSGQMRETLANSLDEFGTVQPTLVRAVVRDGVTRYETLDGHHRRDDFLARGMTTMQVLVVDVPDDLKARKLALSIGRISADWDVPKLSAYVDALIRDGESAASLLASTGFAGDELEQLATQGQGFLDDLARIGGAGAAGGSSRPPGPGTLGSGDHVKISFTALPADHAAVYAAIKLARTANPDLQAVQALAEICREYSRTHGAATPPPAPKARKKKR